MRNLLFTTDGIDKFIKSNSYDVWIDPRNVSGFDKQALKNNSETIYLQRYHGIDGDRNAGDIILDYLLEYILENNLPNFITAFDVVEISLYLIDDLGIPAGYPMAWILSPLLNKENANNLFTMIHHHFNQNNSNHFKNIIRVFACETFRYGMGWGNNTDGDYALLTDKNKSLLSDIAHFKSKNTYMY